MIGCCLRCFEKCIKYISKNAYIQVVLTNSWFCGAAMKAFALILSNMGKFGAVHTIGQVYNFFGTICITAATGFISYLIMGAAGETSGFGPVESPVVIVIICTIVGLSVAQMFLSIFSFAADAILQCYLLTMGSLGDVDF